MRIKKQGIALLITAMFVIVITVAIGFTLKQINDTSRYVDQETTMYQNFIFAEDILNILNNSKELQEVVKNDDPVDLFTFLETSGFITFEYSGVRLIVKIESARNKYSINELSKAQEGYLLDYFVRHNVRGEYLELIKDSISGIKEDGYYYRTRIFDKEPSLFRDYIASMQHLKRINRYYKNEYRDDALEAIEFDKLFAFASDDENRSIDLNYVTPEVLELITGVTPQKAELLQANDMVYSTIEDFYKVAALSEDEKLRLEKFHPSVFEPYLYIKMDIIKDNLISHMSFEYDIKNKRGYNFVYEI
ncbi:MAG: hypothetical protein ABXS93_05355 [Sulfurimonas sp.]